MSDPIQLYALHSNGGSASWLCFADPGDGMLSLWSGVGGRSSFAGLEVRAGFSTPQTSTIPMVALLN